MGYSGAVKVGGPADVHELTDLMISKVAVGPMDNNAYVLRCRATDEQLLIDAAAEPHTLLSLIGDSGIRSVVTTHRHGDHWGRCARWSMRRVRGPMRGGTTPRAFPCPRMCRSRTATPSPSDGWS